MLERISPLYEINEGALPTHWALRWRGRLRYIIPRDPKAQAGCWAVFQPGRLGIALRIKAYQPHLSSSRGCCESAVLRAIRTEIGSGAGISCLRTGAEGVWHKDTVVLLHEDSGKPEVVVKAGATSAVGALLENEANWLRQLTGNKQLRDSLPRFAGAGTVEDLTFVAQTAVSGTVGFDLGEAHFEFLRRFQDMTHASLPLEETVFWQTVNRRVEELTPLLPEVWVERLQRALLAIEEALSGPHLAVSAAHNDFTGWNIKLDGTNAKVFDWEYAALQQLPLFDPLHFNLAPMALRGDSMRAIEIKMEETIALSRSALGRERCYRPREQALAYMLNLCTLYLWADRGGKISHPTLISYGKMVDALC